MILQCDSCHRLWFDSESGPDNKRKVSVGLQNEWQMDTCQYQTILVADIPRVNCNEHGVSPGPGSGSLGRTRIGFHGCVRDVCDTVNEVRPERFSLCEVRQNDNEMTNRKNGFLAGFIATAVLPMMMVAKGVMPARGGSAIIKGVVFGSMIGAVSTSALSRKDSFLTRPSTHRPTVPSRN